MIVARLVGIAFGLGLCPQFGALLVPFAQTDRGEGQVAGPRFNEATRRALHENPGNVARVMLDQHLTFGAA
jgi:hypothetical protein